MQILNAIKANKCFHKTTAFDFLKTFRIGVYGFFQIYSIFFLHNKSHENCADIQIMKLIILAQIITLLVTQLVLLGNAKTECSISNFDLAFPNYDYIVYGIRSDTKIFIAPKNLLKKHTDEKFRFALKNDYEPATQATEAILYYEAFMVEVHGLLQFIAFWQEPIYRDVGVTEVFGLSRLTYVEAFRLGFEPRENQLLSSIQHTTLLYFSDLTTNHLKLRTTKDGRIFVFKTATNHNRQYEIILGRTGAKLFVENTIVTNSPPRISRDVIILGNHNNEYKKW
ncbi:unnamed protein product [Thelazia callipaeda]|uniref:Uncharacterized protein n=1 Tax=Thelazia callipaeda TaxID=103827 RepID=A0A0N5CQY2_THECL|nr:unnamed protein product [Thelazia callipaeda]